VILTLDQLKAKVAAQATAIPALYGRVDFGLTPERFADRLDDESALVGGERSERMALLDNRELVGRFRAYTMLGDTVADAYAALMPEHGFRGLIGMLVEACDKGVEAMDGAPDELVAFIRAMEKAPAWLDMGLVEEGARIDRNGAAHIAPFAVRAAFLATFMNKYAALPMALTGTLSNESARRRVLETATFFTTSTLPGALERHGPGFKAAAMVRLMHSMVRFNALRKGEAWDVGTYGIPIPQVDQMPAGLISITLMARKLLRRGRTSFTPAERARVELARYRCFLLGLPEDLLPDTPQGLVEVMATRQATLRRGYDDATCGELVRATMAASLAPDESLRSRAANAVERGFSKVLFVNNFMSGDSARAAKIGVRLTAFDKTASIAVTLLIALRLGAYGLARRMPGLRILAERALLGKVTKLLRSYGHAEFTTDPAAYRPAHLKAAA
jgi:hypothetical protein